MELEIVSRVPYRTFENLCVKVKLYQPVMLYVVYRPPPAKKNRFTTQQFLEDIEDLLSSIVTYVTEDVCIVGDFKLHLDRNQHT